MAEVRKLRQAELLPSVASPLTPEWPSTQVWALPPAAKVIKRTRIRISDRPKDSSPFDWLLTDALKTRAEKDSSNHLIKIKENLSDFVVIQTSRQFETVLSLQCCKQAESGLSMWLFLKLSVYRESPSAIPPAVQGSKRSSAQQGHSLLERNR